MYGQHSAAFFVKTALFLLKWSGIFFFITFLVLGFIRNIDLVLVHFSCIELLKPLGSSKCGEHKGVFCYANEATFGKHLGDLLVKVCWLGN